ncbi:sulfatase family protein [Pelagicoccus mobilis]|uniref:Sulfatase n=1 Tax=Pelagicoccus mobilis TaxID=415221 RepID=A0A934S0Z3_9BACT|nr:sulfatase [Pelagicoccus mobilis]MBK1879180.1 sulfatase [Pelagicoccus mobilis]
MRITLLASILISLLTTHYSTLGAKAPHILFLIADDLGPYDTGFMGNPDVRTPALDQLAKKSVLLENTFVASPSCAPSRGALLSGLMPFRNGAEPNHTYVRDDVKQLPHYMHELGYEVAAIGKISHGNDKRVGFDYENRKISVDDIGNVSDYLTQRESDKPLLLMVGIKDPHVPWPKKAFDHYDPDQLTVHPQLIDTPETRLELARYYSDVEKMDQQIAATLEAVEEHLGPDTIIFFTADHGAQLPYGKWNNYDYSLKAPMLVSWPGVTAPDTRKNALISFVDILPTLVELGGGTPPESGYGDTQIDGRSILPLIKGETDHHRDFVYGTNSSAAHHTYPLRSVRSDRFRYVMNVYPELNFSCQTDHNPKGESHYMWEAWVELAKTDPAVAKKLKQYHNRPKEELYDLQKDPHEQNNLANNPEYAETLKALRQQTQTWIEKSGDTLEQHGKPMEILLPIR